MTFLKGTRKDRIENFFATQRIRLRGETTWELLPAGICFTLAMLLIGHLLPGLNPRLGNRANITPLEAELEPDGSVWLGMFIKDDIFHIQTSERNTLKFSVQDLNKSILPQLVTYLELRREKEITLLGSSLSYKPFRSNIVIAADQSLKYVHLRPVINSIAAAGYRRYSFETRIIRDQHAAQAMQANPAGRL